MDEFLAIAIVGVVASLVIEGINRWLDLDSLKSKAMTLAVTIGLGLVYVILKDTVWWKTILEVLMAASTVYAFFLKKKE